MTANKEKYISQFTTGVWYELEKFPLEQSDFTKLIGFSKEWIHPDFNPDGTRECFINGDLGWTSLKYVDYQDCWVEDFDTIPTHFLIITSTQFLIDDSN